MWQIINCIIEQISSQYMIMKGQKFGSTTLN